MVASFICMKSQTQCQIVAIYRSVHCIHCSGPSVYTSRDRTRKWSKKCARLPRSVGSGHLIYTSPSHKTKGCHRVVIELFVLCVASNTLLYAYKRSAPFWKCDSSRKEGYFKCCTSSALLGDMGYDIQLDNHGQILIESKLQHIFTLDNRQFAIWMGVVIALLGGRSYRPQYMYAVTIF